MRKKCHRSRTSTAIEEFNSEKKKRRKRYDNGARTEGTATV
jgi:hypothetical protein